MQAGIRVAAFGVTALAWMLPATGPLHADPGACTVPADTTNQYLILYGGSRSVPAAANGESMAIVRFPSQGSLQYMVAGTGVWHDSTYTYTSPEPGVAVIDATESAAAGPVTYSVTLRCRTNESGSFSYTGPGADAPSTDNAAPGASNATYRFSRSAI
ncbi:hypothetical protein ACFRAQ_03090 [Nocardia sp. NPDC056611]|uniref:hypothetical protein n=1 Tax=Nocardia sp. NPDC056611 TaxID=3345877 RepID=UPI003670B14A